MAGLPGARWSLVLAMPAAGGAQRWIPLGPLNVQPSEFAKLVAVLFMAYMLSRKEEQVNELRIVLVPCLGGHRRAGVPGR